jgi:hypothetical protein
MPSDENKTEQRERTNLIYISLPENPPDQFSKELWPQTYESLLKVQKGFPFHERTQTATTVALCRYALRELVQIVRTEIKTQRVTAGDTMLSVANLLKWLVSHNAPLSLDPLERRVKESPEWMAVVKAITEAQRDSTGCTASKQELAANRTEPSTHIQSEPQAPRRRLGRGDPEVARRAALVRSNPHVPTDETCEILDRESVALPEKWQEAGFRKWIETYRNPKYRGRIDTMFAKDRRRA